MKNEDFASNLVKGRIAETLVEEMFQASGYQVYRFGYEAILQNISQLRKEIKDSRTFERIKSIPDFLVVSPNGAVQLVEVKYKADGELKPYSLKKYAEFWKESMVLVVSAKEPHFRIAYIEQFLEDEKLHNLKSDRYTRVDPILIEKFEKVVKQYFRD